MSDAVPALEKGNVRFSQEMLAEVDRGHPVVRVQKDHVQSIALRRGFRAARPIVQGVLGAALLGVPLYVFLGAFLAEVRRSRLGYSISEESSAG